MTGSRCVLTLVLVSVLLSSCGGDGSGSPSNTTPPVTLESIAVTPATLSTGVGVKRQIKATGTYSDGSTQDLTASATWSSSATSTATVTGGAVIGVAVGSSTITVSSAGVTATTALSVTSNAWSLGAPAPYAAGWPTATTLTDGTVLMVGQENDDDSPSQPTTAIYDPVADTWTTTQRMTTGRAGATATLLQSGNVLVVGGTTAAAELEVATAEWYSASAQTWSSASSLPEPRRFHTATLLPDGQVLVAGGDDGQSDLLDTELYDPTTNTWSATGNLIAGCDAPAAVLLGNGTVLLVGCPGNAVQIYNPSTGTWSAGAAMNDSHSEGPTATLLANGDVLVAGGLTDSGTTTANSAAELYDPSTNMWSSAGSMATGVYFHTASLLPNGQVLVTGGWATVAGVSSPTAVTELYDPAANIWESAGNMSVARVFQAAAVLPDGEVVITGGGTVGSNHYTTNTDLYWY